MAEALKDFLVNNYLWFLIISIVLVFALIGYLVDTKKKEDSIQKVEKTQKEKKKKETKVVIEDKNTELKTDEKPEEVKVENVEEKEEGPVLGTDNSVIYDDPIPEEEKK